MKRLFTALSAVAALALIPSQAVAGPIVIDPIIGVRGLDAGSTASNNSDFVGMGGCDTESDTSLSDHFGAGRVFCESYFLVSPLGENPVFSEGPYFGITSLTFRFSDAGGGIVQEAFVADETSGQNQLPQFSTSETDPYEVTLSLGDTQIPTCYANNPESESHTTCFQVYLAIPLSEGSTNPPYRVSLTKINGVVQDPNGLAPVPNAVPEPGSLLLLGTGLATLVGSRFRRKAA